MKEWQELYPELVNKLRWAISTTFGDDADRYPFGDSQRIATVFAQEIVELVKCAQNSPGVLAHTALIRGFRQQNEVDEYLKPLDKITR